MALGEEKIRIAVMGATGSGKSTFINVASGSNLPVSDSLESCTIDVAKSTFFLDGRTITLIDTPGFDDTTRSDTDILKLITDYLSKSYTQGARLAGLIYMHRITDNKMGGPSKRNFHIFRNLCGDAGLKNVLLVTNMWSKVDPEEGEARERELASKDKFFKPALDRDARMLRHDGSQVSAHEILHHLFDRKPTTLLIQDEMVNQEKDLAHTTAGADIMRELKEQGERHAQALEDLCLGIEAARLAEDEETREILQEEARKAREKIERIRTGLEQMVTNFAAANSRLENENWQYKKDFEKQKAIAEHNGQLLERERQARELAEAGERKAQAQLAAERKSREPAKGGGSEREYERLSQGDGQQREQEDKRTGQERGSEKKEAETQKHEREKPNDARQKDGEKAHKIKQEAGPAKKEKQKDSDWCSIQ